MLRIRSPRLPFLAPAALLLAAGLLSACKDKPAAPVKPAPVEVGVVVVTAQDAALQLELPGRLSASQSAEIRPQVGGLVLKRLFTEGTRVKAGQPLYQLDNAAFEAERARAAAALQKAEAQRAAARTKAARDAELLRVDALSRQAADESAAAVQQANADVAVARAALDAARVQLQRAAITAPISGRIEISSVSAGALVTANQTQALTTIQQLDPMHVDIVQSSAELLALRRQLDGRPTNRQAQLVLEDGSVHPQPAVLQFSGVTVDQGTGTVTLRAVVPNPRGTLAARHGGAGAAGRRRRPRRAAGTATGRDAHADRRRHGADAGRGQQGRTAPAQAGPGGGQPVAGDERAAGRRPADRRRLAARAGRSDGDAGGRRPRRLGVPDVPLRAPPPLHPALPRRGRPAPPRRR